MSREVKDERSVVVVSDLDPEPDENEILENFEKYGCLDKVLIAKHRPWVALVYFDDKRVAREAARCLDGTRMSGSRVTVELASGITIRSKCESSKVYMYDLGNGATKREICEIFKVFGRLKHVWAENQRDEYVVIVYEKAHQARDAVRNLDGTLINGMPVRVKLASERDIRVSQSSEEVYVGNLGSATDVREIEDTFMPFGALRRVWVSRNPEGCALVWFKDERDAREAVWCLDRRWLNDRQISVKLTKSWSHWCCWMPKNEGNSSNNLKHSTIAGNCKTLPRTFKVSYGFDCIYTQSYKDDQLHANSMKSTVADDKRYHSKTSKIIPIASIDSIDDWDGNKVNETVPDEVCVRNDDTVRREGSAQKRKSVEIEDDKARLQLEKTSKVNQLARLLEYRPKDVGDDGDASEMRSSDVAGSVNCANDGSVDKKAKSLRAKVKVKSTTVETAGDKKRKLEKKKRKKSKNENHSPDGRSKSSTPSYEYKFVENDYKVNNNNTSNISSSSNNNNNSNINYSNSTYETGEFPAPENESAQTEFNVNNLNNNGSTKNNNNNNSNNNINNSDNTCESVVFPALENESAQTDFNLNNVNGINSNDNIDDDNLNNSNNNINKDCDNPSYTVEFPAPEDCPPVMVEIVPRPTEESQNNPPNEERFSEGISDVEMRNAEVVATVNDSPEDDAMAMTSMTMTSLPLTSSSSSSADPTTLTGLPLVRVDKRSADGTPTGVCPQPSTIYIIHHHHHHYHYHHYHYHHRNQHRLAGDGDLVASTESDQ